MDFGDFCRYYKACRFEEFIRSNILVVNDAFRVGWISQSAIRVWFILCLFAELIDERVMFAGEEVVQEAQTDGPVVSEGGRFLASPLRLNRIAWREHGQVAALLHEELSPHLPDRASRACARFSSKP